jgi:hypothetical protein
MKTSLFYFTMAFALISLSISAQETPTPRIHQFGIQFSSLDNFGLNYKTGNQKTLLRLSLLTIDLGQHSQWGRPEDSTDIKQQSYGAGFRVGFEKHLPVAKKFDLIWGLEFGSNFSYNKQTFEAPYNNYESSSWNLTPMLNLILGANYSFSEHFILGAEITPGFRYTLGKSKNTNTAETTEITTSSFGFGFTTSYASLSLAYRFGK